MTSPFGGTVFPVNPKRPSVLGIKAYPTLADVPAAVDLAEVFLDLEATCQIADEVGLYPVARFSNST